MKWKSLSSLLGKVTPVRRLVRLRIDSLEDRATPAAAVTGVPGTVRPLLGESASYSFNFTNNGSAPAGTNFTPFIDVAVDTSGPDGAAGAPFDGLGVPTVTAAGLSMAPAGTITLTAGQTTYIHPLTGDTRPVPPGFGANDTIYVYLLPFGSFTPGQTTAVSVQVPTSNLGDPGTAMPVSVTPGFRDIDPVAPFSPSYGTTQTTQINPELWRLTKTYIGPEDETATGPNFVRRYRLEVDIATGQTLNSLQVTDDLANSMQLTGTTAAQMAAFLYTAGAPGANVFNSANRSGTAVATAPDGTVIYNFGTRVGQAGTDAAFEFEFFVPRDRATGPEVLPQTTDSTQDNNTASASASWPPLDGRDASPQAVSITLPATAHTLEEHSLAVQKTVDVVTAGAPNTPAVGPVQPGQSLLRYTINFQVSDYYALNNIFLQDILGDGLRLYVNGGLTPTLTVNNPWTFAGGGTRAATSSGAFGTGGASTIDYERRYSITGLTESDPSLGIEGYGATGPIGSPYTAPTVGAIDGTTQLVFRISDELIARGLPGILVGGEIANGGGAPQNVIPAPFGGATGTIVFWAQVKDDFSDDFPSGDSSIDQGDLLTNDVPLIQGNHLLTTDLADGTPTQTGTFGTDDSGASTEVARGVQTKTVFAINGNTIPTQTAADTVFSIQPGDTVTYKLTYTLPISRFEDLEILDIPPLPVIPVGAAGSYTFDRTFDGSYNVREIEVAPDDTFFSTFPGFADLTPGGTITTDTTTNTLRLNFGDFEDLLDRFTTISLLVTFQIEDAPFASDLFLTNQLRVNETSTNQGSTTVEDIRRIQIVRPSLFVDKGIVGFNTTGRTLGGISFNAPGGATTFGGGAIDNQTEADAIGAANLNNQTDAGDSVRYAIVAQNTGRGDAYNVRIADQIPAGYDIPVDFATFAPSIRRGDGTLLTLGVDYTLVSYSNVTGAWEIELVDNYTTGNVNVAGLTIDDREGSLSRGESTPFVNAGDNPTPTPITNGSNTVVIQYDLTLAANVAPNQQIVNTALITTFSSSETGVDLTDPNNVPGATDPQDTATNEITDPANAKSLIDTSIVSGSNANAEVVIGEIATYELTVTIPEGVTPGAELFDQLAAGLTFVDVIAASATAGLTFTGGLPSLSATPTNTTIANGGRNITFTFGDITNNTNPNNGGLETITIRYRALVTNTNVAPANNQAGATRTNTARFRWTGNATTLATVSAAPVTIIEPTVAPTKTVTNVTAGTGPSTTLRGDAGDTVRYTITFSNGNTAADTTAFDVSLADAIPTSLSGLTIFSATSTGTVSVNGVVQTVAVGDFQLVGNALSNLSNLDMEPGSSVTVVVEGTFAGSSGGFAVVNTADVRWTSLDGVDANERTGVDGPLNGGTLNDYRSLASANLETPPIVRKTLVASSYGPTAPANGVPGTIAGQAVIGEVVRYRIVTSIGEGTSNHFQLRDNLPAGVRFLNDGSARFGLVTSNGTDLNSVGVPNVSAVSGGGIVGDETTIATIASAAVTGVFADNNISIDSTGTGVGDPIIYSGGQDVYFRFGDLTNTDSDLAVEYVMVEFNAIVENVVGNQSATLLTNDFSVLSDTDNNGTPGFLNLLQDTDGNYLASVGDTTSNTTDAGNNGGGAPGVSNPVTLTVAEPSLSITKQAIATTGGTVRYRVTVANAAGATVSPANEVRVVDVLNGVSLTLVGGSVGNYAVATGTAGAFADASAGNTVDATISFIDPGSSITFEYVANVLTTPSGATTLNNTATTTGTSLTGDNITVQFFGTDPATLGLPSSSTGERTGVGAINDYTANDSEALGSIGDRVYVDADGDGVQDAGEPGIVGAPVTVRWAGPNGTFGDLDDSVINAVTGANGIWTVTGLPVDSPGAYQVSVDTTGAPFTTFGLNTFTDSVDNGGAPSPVTPSTISITAAVPNPRTQDFGYSGTGSIGDRVWNDQDGDQTQDAGEPGIPNVTVQVTWHGQDGVLGGGDDAVYTAVTDAAGNYTIANLPLGDFTVAVQTPTLPDNVTATFDLDGIASANSAIASLTVGAPTRTDVDFGYRGQASVGDRVWYDVDGDGVQDASEPGIVGATVTLLFGGDDGDLTTVADNITYTATTGVNGAYLFAGLPGGDFVNGTDPNYRVTVAPPAGYTVQTFDADGLGTANTSALQVAVADANLLQDFGYQGTAALGDVVFNDLNANGRQDGGGEVGIAGVTVELLDGANNVLASTTTGAGGTYAFTGLVDTTAFGGPYRVRFGNTAAAVTYTRSPQDVVGAGFTEANDSDASQTTGITGDITLGTGATNNDVDAGLIERSSIGDRVWYDVDADGTQDVGEPGIVGATVELLDATGTTVLATTTTGADGIYTFPDRDPGTYQVRVSNLPNGLTNPTGDLDGVGTPSIATVTLAAGADRTDVDFGYNGLGSLGDLIWSDADGDGVRDAGEPGLPSVQVNLTWFGPNGVLGGGDDVVYPTATTSTTGIYGFANLPAGSFAVDVVNASLPVNVTLTTGVNSVGSDPFTTTLTPAQNRTDVDFGYVGTASIGDRVWYDVDGDGVQDNTATDGFEPGMSGMTMTLLGAGPDNTLFTADDMTYTTVTGANGIYSFPGLPVYAAGTPYRVIATPRPGFPVQSFDADGLASLNNSTLTLAPNEANVVQDFGYHCLGVLGNFVWEDANANGIQDGTEVGIPGVTVELLAQDGTILDVTTTGAGGIYAFNGIADTVDFGQLYRIRFGNTAAGVTYTRTVADVAGSTEATDSDANTTTGETANITLASGEINNNFDAGLYRPLTIGNRVYFDADADGVQDAGEVGISGSAISATWHGPDGVLGGGDDQLYTTTTGADGIWSIANLPPGSYTVSATPPGAIGLGTITDSIDNAALSATNPVVIAAASGTDRVDVDFGFQGTLTVGDRVWNDIDSDGIQDAGEPGLAGVQVRLTWAGQDGTLGTADDFVFPPATTDNAGIYGFANLPTGQYRAEVLTASLPVNVVATGDLDGVATAGRADFLLPLSRTDVDFGYAGTASIGDRVWYDVDGDGVQDASNADGNEPGIAGVAVTLTGAGPDNALGTADDVVYTTTTGLNGAYSFPGLPVYGAGTPYRVSVTPAAGYPTQTFDADGLGTANASTLTLVPAENNTAQDFGYRGPGTQAIGNFVWEDTNANGVQDGTEVGIAGVTVELLAADGTVLDVTTTLAGGAYAFTGLADTATFGQQYRVRFGNTVGATTYTRTVQDVATATEATDSDASTTTGETANITLGAGVTNNDIDAGLYQSVTLGNRVFYDVDGDGVQDANEPGIAGVPITITWHGPDGVLGGADDVVFNTVTGADGIWFSPNVPPGTFTVTSAPAGSTGFTVVTDSIDNGVLSPTNPVVITATSGVNRTDVDFGYRGTASIGDRVWIDVDGDNVQDANEPGLQGVQVQLTWAGADGLFDGNGDVTYPLATTAADGLYSFSDLPAGNFRISVVGGLPGNVTPTGDFDGLATPNVSTTSLTAGQARTDQDFGYRGTASIGDRVWYDVDGDGVQDASNADGNETGIVGVAVTLTGAGPDNALGTADDVVYTTTTGVNGGYSFPGLPVYGAGSPYRVSVTAPAGYPTQTFDADGLATADQSTLTLAPAENNTAQDFGYRGPGTQAIGNFVWEDLNGNGTQDAAEAAAGITGVTVELLAADGTVLDVTTTGANGAYSFSNLADSATFGQYRVRFGNSTLTTTYARTVQDVAGSTEATDSDAATATGETANITLATGTTNNDVDAGLVRLQDIGDRVWYDIDGDGVQDAGEPGIINATATLDYAGPDGVFGTGDDQLAVATTNTALNGAYLFADRVPGTYRVTISNLPASLTAVTFDLDSGTTTPDGVSAATLVSGTDRLDVDFGYRGVLTVGDRVWNDVDGDGIQDVGEPSLPGVQVQLTWAGQDGTIGTADDVVYPIAATDNAGLYNFANLPTGNYRADVVTASLPTNVTPTGDLDGAASANRADFSLIASRTDVDFGYRGSASIGDRVWYDVDGDGVQDANSTDGNEPGISGVPVTLTWAGPDGALGTADDQTYTTTTGANGVYNFPGLPVYGADDLYRVTVTTPTGYPTQTFDSDGLGSANVSTLNLGSTENNVLQDFGYRGPITQGLGNFVWEDLDGNGRQDAAEATGGIAGVTVELLDANGVVIDVTTSGANGAYSFPNLADSATFGQYRVRFGNVAGATTYVRTGLDSPAATDATDSDADPANNGTTGLVSVATGAINDTVDAGLYRLVSLGDRVWYDVDGDGVQDAGEPGIVGATVTATYLGADGVVGGGDDVVLPAVVTGADGIWNITNVQPGNYRVVVTNQPVGLTAATFDLDSGTTTPDGATNVLVLSGTNPTNVDFGFRGTGSLGDRVWDDRDGDGVQDGTDPGLVGVTVQLTWGGFDGNLATTTDNIVQTAVTGANGIYNFPNLPSGNYRVDVLSGVPTTFTPTSDLDGVATPNTATTSLTIGQTRTDVDFGYTAFSSFSGFVYLDADNDGVRDAGEAPIVGAEVRLTGTDLNGNAVNLTALTLANGSYRFANLLPGTYTVAETQPAAFLDGRDTAGTPAIPGMVLANDGFATFQLPSGTDAINYNFGELPATTSIGGFVFFDRNNDGIKASNDTGMAGVLVRLTGTNDLGQPVNLTVVTDASGRYSFRQLRPGTYNVIESQPVGFTDGKDRAGSLGGTTTNDRHSAIVIRPGQQGVNYNFGEVGVAATSLSKRLFINVSAPTTVKTNRPAGSGVTIVEQLTGTGPGQLGTP